MNIIIKSTIPKESISSTTQKIMTNPVIYNVQFYEQEKIKYQKNNFNIFKIIFCSIIFFSLSYVYMIMKNFPKENTRLKYEIERLDKENQQYKITNEEGQLNIYRLDKELFQVSQEKQQYIDSLEQKLSQVSQEKEYHIYSLEQKLLQVSQEKQQYIDILERELKYLDTINK